MLKPTNGYQWCPPKNNSAQRSHVQARSRGAFYEINHGHVRSTQEWIKERKQHFNETATIKHIAQGLMQCAYDQFTCPFLELGCLYDPHNFSPVMPWEVMEWNICTAAPAFWQTMPTTTSRKERFKRLNWILLRQRWQNSTRAHTHMWCFQLHNELVVSPPQAKTCFYRWGSYGIIMLRKMDWSEATNQSPLFLSLFRVNYKPSIP